MRPVTTPDSGTAGRVFRAKADPPCSARQLDASCGSVTGTTCVGEIGQASGSITNGTGSMQANAVIAYILLGVAVIASAALLARLHTRR